MDNKERVQSQKNYKLTEEHKEKISQARKGKKHSAETKAKIKQTMIKNKGLLLENHRLVAKTTQSRSHLTAEDVRDIRNRYSNEADASIRQLAKQYNVSRHTIHSIVTYRLWK